MSLTMRIPKLCAKCGENPPTTVHTVQEERRTISPWTLLTMFVGVSVTNRRTITYGVPLCAECEAKMNSRKRVAGFIILAGGLLVVGAIVLLLSQTNALNSVGFLISAGQQFGAQPRETAVLGLIFVGVVMWFIAFAIGRTKFASTNGETFRFHNKEFQKAFAELNPHLVKKSRWSRDTLAD